MLQLSNITKNFSSARKTVRNSGSEITASKKSELDLSEAVVKNLNLTIEKGEFFSLLGPSGCGKTTLLRMIAGLEYPTSGEILLNGERVDQKIPQERPFNMVFQRYALFPHMTVFQNVAFGLKLKKLPQDLIQQKVMKALDLVNLTSFAQRYPETLSGGQSQRVAIARALVNEPQILLLDEPLSALDMKLREHMQTELKALQRKLGLTFIYVTHDQEEALALSDRIGVMNQGRLEQVSRPEELYQNPSTLFTAQFVGSMSSFRSPAIRENAELLTLKIGSKVIRVKMQKESAFKTEDQILAFIRPEKLKLFPMGAEVSNQHPQNHSLIEALVEQTIFRGTEFEVHMNLGSGCNLKAFIQTDEIQGLSLQSGSRVQVLLDSQDLFLFSDSQ